MESRNADRIAYFLVEPAMVPLICLCDGDGLRFARITPECLRRVLGGVEPSGGDLVLFGLPVLSEGPRGALLAS